MDQMMKAVVVEKQGDRMLPKIGTLKTSDLPEGEVVIKVTHTALNYSDAAYMFGRFGEPPKFPHVPGIDFVGTVEKSSNPAVRVGETYMHTSHGVGYNRWGGMAQYAVSNRDWLIKKPDHLSNEAMMGLGTVGLTAMLAIKGLQRNRVDPSRGAVLVTGASGGVGSMAIQMLSKLGYDTIASTGKTNSASYLKKIGAKRIIERHELEKLSKEQLWSGAIDCVSGSTLRAAIEGTKYGGCVVISGVASGFNFPLETVAPFVMKAISLVGIDTVMAPAQIRREAWGQIFKIMNEEDVRRSIRLEKFSDLPQLGEKILNGQSEGRIVVPLE